MNIRRHRRSHAGLSFIQRRWFIVWIFGISAVWIYYSTMWFDSFTSTSSSSTHSNDRDVAPIVLSVGLPKSGTTSLYHYFHCSGYPTSHYCCCGAINETQYPCKGGKLISQQIQENRMAQEFLWKGLQDAVVHTQLDGEVGTDSYFLPQFSLLQELHQSAPMAYWILPLRSPLSWKASVSQWLDMEQRLRNYYHRHAENDNNRNNNPHLAVINDDDSFLVKFYQLHTQRVREFCKDKRPAGRCIEMDISNPKVGAKLQKAFPNTKAECWQRHNAGPMFRAFPAVP